MAGLYVIYKSKISSGLLIVELSRLGDIRFDNAMIRFSKKGGRNPSKMIMRRFLFERFFGIILK
jgi:hypothetical protein